MQDWQMHLYNWCHMEFVAAFEAVKTTDFREMFKIEEMKSSWIRMDMKAYRGNCNSRFDKFQSKQHFSKRGII